MIPVTIESLLQIFAVGALWGGYVGWAFARHRAAKRDAQRVHEILHPDPDTPFINYADLFLPPVGSEPDTL